MEVGLVISDKIGKYGNILRAKLRGKHALCCSSDVSSLKYPVISGDLSFVAWDTHVCHPAIISLFHKISQLYENIPCFLIEHDNVDDILKRSIERCIQHSILGNFNLELEMERFVEVLRALPAVDDEERKLIRKIYHNVIGDSENIENLRVFVAKVAKNSLPVLLSATAGCGKGMVAKIIHEGWCEKSGGCGKFVSLDLQYVPEDLMEHLLFGLEMNSFRRESIGSAYKIESLFQRANGGTLFLKNIDKASLLLQTKLFEALEEKEEEFKLICTSEDSLCKLVSEKKFREDLYYKITVQEFKIEDLCDRKEDIEGLAKDYCASHNCVLHDSAVNKLRLYDWRGNVRQLFSILDKALLSASKIGVVYPESIRLFD